jgi:hypothetical protein
MFQVCNLWKRVGLQTAWRAHTRFEEREITTLDQSKGNDGLIEMGKVTGRFSLETFSVSPAVAEPMQIQSHPPRTTPHPPHRRDEEQITRSGC